MFECVDIFQFLIAKSGRSTLSGVVFVLLVSNLESASTVWLYIPARWFTSTLNTDKRDCRRAIRPNLFDRFKIHLSESRLVQVENRLPSRYARKI